MSLCFKHGQADELETLHPAYFALVMATGIVATATRLHGVPLVPTIMFWLNAFFLAGLAAALCARILRYTGAFVADVRSHSRGVGFFTVAAAVGVFGSQLVLQMQAMGMAIFFWAITGALWLAVVYGVLAALTVVPNKPNLATGINGGWLVCVVATQSFAILTVLILPSDLFTDLQQPLMFAALALWLSAGALYLCLITLIFFRYTFMPMSPEDLTPPYWINMGAVAISTLAGATIMEHSTLSPIVMDLAPFVKGFTLFFWAFGTAWIPMLLILGIWRYLIRGVPFAYDPLYWGGVFPLGMYSACTYHLANILKAPFLMPLSYTFMIIAFVAWAVTFVGLIDSRLAKHVRASPPSRFERTNP